jgi:hypothetical protein
MVEEKCRTGERGQLIRGIVTRIECPICHRPRFDDGTKCKRCGSYAKLHNDETAETIG